MIETRKQMQYTEKVLAYHNLQTYQYLACYLQALLQSTETPWNSLHIHKMASVLVYVQTTYEHMSMFSLLS